MLNISPIGRNCSQSERDAFEQYDKKTNIRKTMVAAMEADRARLEPILGLKIFTSLLSFYSSIRDLYAGGNLGGIEIYAEKPLGW